MSPLLHLFEPLMTTKCDHRFLSLQSSSQSLHFRTYPSPMFSLRQQTTLKNNGKIAVFKLNSMTRNKTSEIQLLTRYTLAVISTNAQLSNGGGEFWRAVSRSSGNLRFIDCEDIDCDNIENESSFVLPEPISIVFPTASISLSRSNCTIRLSTSLRRAQACE